MKNLLFFFLLALNTVTASSQILKKNDQVQVDLLLSETKEGSWQNAVITDVDMSAKTYSIKLANGDKKSIPSRNPEKWIRPVAKNIALLGPSRQIRYESRPLVINAFSCKPSEIYVKRNVKAKLAEHFKDYPFIYVDFTSFKGQKGYDDKKVKFQQVYPYKIEMRVYLKRSVTMGGKEFTEYQTWEFDRVYEYATRPGNKCEFTSTSNAEGKLLSAGWFQ